MTRSLTRRPVFIGLVAVAIAWSWMFLTVQFMYGGNWTALYLIGSRTPFPASVAPEHLYIFPNNSGYDGQSFHVTAHDPWMRRYTPGEMEIEPFRYARILVPALAWTLAFGQDRWIDPAYYAVILASVFLGAYWIARYAARVSIDPAWGLIFLLSPATLTSIDRMLVDVTLAALCAGFVLYAGEGRWKMIVILAAALLTRETAWIVFAAYELFLLLRRRFADVFVTAIAAIPLIAWQSYLDARAGASSAAPRLHTLVPFAGLLDRIAHQPPYDLPHWQATLTIAFDYVALAGMALAIALAMRIGWSSFMERAVTPTVIAICGFAIALIFLRGQAQWNDPWGFGRIFAPLPLMLAMDYMPSRIWLGLAPTLLIDSRIALNYGRHAQEIIHNWIS